MASENIRLMRQADLHLVLSWRNHPSIQRYMYTQHEISLAEHQAWFTQASQSPSKYLLIYEIEETPMGFIQLTQFRMGNPVADWGFYVAPNSPKGTGRGLGWAALEFAFESLGLQKICGQALAFNEPSIRFHRALGFQQEGVLRHQHYDGQNFHDVLCFGILKPEWQEENKVRRNV